MNEPVEAPQTREGWYVLHDQWRLDWPRWQALTLTERQHRYDELVAWLGQIPSGDSAAYAVLGQKADLLFVHYRRSLPELHALSAALRRLGIFEELSPTGSFVSVIEASLYEVTARVRGTLARRGLQPGAPGYDEALASETASATAALEERLFRTIPTQSYLCWYPMSKRRSGGDNWYTLSTDERRTMMRSHGTVGHQFVSQVTQVVSGAIGLDDWEWGVDLHGDDPLAFKKLVTAMRYDEASARFAEFGPFIIGLRQDAAALKTLLLS
jgi:chlorite dismutase